MPRTPASLPRYLPAVQPADTVPPPIDSPAEASSEARLQWIVLPVATYDADDGFGAGARAEIVKPGGDPYRTAFVIHLIATVRGFHHHRIRFDQVGLGGNDDLRLTGHFAFRAWLNDGYWGLGNATRLDPAFVGTFDWDDPRRTRYRYRLVQPFANLTLRAGLGGPYEAFVSVQPRWSFVSTYEGSLLDEQRPYGMEGGPAVQIAAGAIVDSRAPEVSPHTGWAVEASGRLVVGAYTFGGPQLNVRAYAGLGPDVVVASRLMAEHLFGEVPFYEMNQWGGSLPVVGFGGADSLRGVPFGRWRGPGKAVWNTELRLDVWHTTLAKAPTTLQLAPFVDAGVVWGVPGDAAVDGVLPVHPGAGLGVRGLWGEATVGRFDVAVAPDHTTAGDRATLGLYLSFDHVF